MTDTVPITIQQKLSTSASLGYSLAMIKMFLDEGLITKEEYDRIEENIEKYYAKA